MGTQASKINEFIQESALESADEWKDYEVIQESALESADKSRINKIIQDSALESASKWFLPDVNPEMSFFQIEGKKPTRKSNTQSIQTIKLKAQPILQNSLDQIENVIKGIDGRRRIERTEDWPSSAHGLVSMNFKGEIRWGSGTLISSNIVLTAAHNLYYRKGFVDVVEFMPAMNGHTLPFGKIKVEEYFVPEEYVNSGKEGQEDYALLLLEEPIGEITGYFGLSVLNSNVLLSKTITVTGYPYDKVKDKHDVYEMWEKEGKPASVNQDLIDYTIPTVKGNSGGGVWYEENGSVYIVGVHVQGNSIVNAATLMTKKRYERICGWIKNTIQRMITINPERFVKKIKESKLTSSEVNILSNYIMENIEQLDLSSGWTEGLIAKERANYPPWFSLEKQNLSWNKIGDNGAEALSKNTTWGNLQQLNLSWNQIGDIGAEALSKNTTWGNLQQLDLSENRIRHIGAEALAKNTIWGNLQQLDLSGNQIGDIGAEALAKNTIWGNLQQLDLSGNQIGDIGAKALAKNTTWGNLQQLDLSWNQIGNIGAEALSKNTTWGNLQQLNLRENQIGDIGAKALSKNTTWGNLQQLDLSWNQIGILELKHLQRRRLG